MLMQKWCKLKVQSPHHERGYAITPTAASGLAAFYSATSRFVAFLAILPHGGAWLHDGRHKDICGVLRKWREAVKDGVAPDSCTAELVAFLQRENSRCPKDADGAPEAVLS